MPQSTTIHFSHHLLLYLSLGEVLPGDKKKIVLAVPGKPSFAIYCGTTGK